MGPPKSTRSSIAKDPNAANAATCGLPMTLSPKANMAVARLGAQLLMQAALEAEVTEFLGRDRYQRAAACDDVAQGLATGTGT